MLMHTSLFATVCALPLLLAGAALVQDGAPHERDLSKVTRQEKLELRVQHMALMAPCAEHELLAKYAGEFEVELKVWMEPGAEPLISSARCTNRMVLGGRYLETLTSGELMGMPMETLKLVGFDRRSSEFTLSGFDTMGTSPTTARGGWREPGKCAVLSGASYDPLGQYTQRYDFVLTLVDDDTMRWDVVFTDRMHSPDGSPAKLVEITARRKK